MRTFVGDAVRSRIGGEGGRALIAELASDAPGWFGEDSPTRIVHADAAMFVGGMRALLLQSMHPVAMAAVADNSAFRSDPWGRLQRTAAFLTETTFGSAGRAEAACRRVRSVHRRVRGETADRVTYRADDPELLLWVHVAEVDSFLDAHRRYGRVELTDAQQDAYVAEMSMVARHLGVIDPPLDRAALAEALARFRPVLGASDQARAGARFLLKPPGLSLAARPAYSALLAGAVTSLPWWVRLDLRLPLIGPVTGRVLVPMITGSTLGAMRWALEAPVT
ncbi:MAG: oxygenase MpaB family protein [Acidimicrobiia bacterium]